MRERRDNREIQAPRRRRMLAVADWRLLTTGFMVAALLLMLWRGEWVGMCSLGAIVWLMKRTAVRAPSPPAIYSANKPVNAGDSTPSPNAETCRSSIDGSLLMLEKIAPVWLNQFDAMNQVLQFGSHELLSSVSSLDEGVTQIKHRLVAPATEADNETLTELANQLEPHCMQAMHALQFGDRLSQMLLVLKSDVQRYLQQAPAMTHCGPADAEQWLDELSARYTTEEQRQAHAGELKAPNPETVDFF
ncbi:hypothetical protein [Roseateles koreensis]|uniref:Chemotaxis protein n=1 Tax=Roseateles koreensis TaxID=2987526 RepID=A0ABT5KVZ8_9BURK|nr:hypothetical protein [Roseateles koreensis]MDC8785962.1 hypothetical protein [Roseateles koreensis]